MHYWEGCWRLYADICCRIYTEALWFCLFVVVQGIEFRASHIPGKHFTTGKHLPPLYFQLPGVKKKNKLISRLGFFHSLRLLFWPIESYAYVFIVQLTSLLSRDLNSWLLIRKMERHRVRFVRNGEALLAGRHRHCTHLLLWELLEFEALAML